MFSLNFAKTSSIKSSFKPLNSERPVEFAVYGYAEAIEQFP